MRIRVQFICLITLLTLGACGVKGPPLPPVETTPQEIEAQRARDAAKKAKVQSDKLKPPSSASPSE